MKFKQGEHLNHIHCLLLIILINYVKIMILVELIVLLKIMNPRIIKLKIMKLNNKLTKQMVIILIQFIF